MRSLVFVLSFLVGHSAFAIYMVDGELLFDGSTLMISNQTLQGTLESGIKDARKYRDFVMVGETGGVLENSVQQGAVQLTSTCSNGSTIISIYKSEWRSVIFKIDYNGNTYYRPGNDREDGTGAYHIESIENFMNPLESSLSGSGNQSDDILTLNCN